MTIGGSGTIVTATVVHRGSPDGPATPYRVAFVDMDAGYRLFGPVAGPHDTGDRVAIRFADAPSPGDTPITPPYWFEANTVGADEEGRCAR